MKILAVETAAQLEQVRRLFEEYWASFGLTPCFQGFGAALRKFDAHRCEAKRLYVRPQFRGCGVGRALLHWIIAEARQAGYREIVGDTMPVMERAIEMYDRSGFERTAPYAESPTPGAIILRLRL